MKTITQNFLLSRVYWSTILFFDSILLKVSSIYGNFQMVIWIKYKIFFKWSMDIQLDKDTSFSHMAFSLMVSDENGQKWPKMDILSWKMSSSKAWTFGYNLIRALPFHTWLFHWWLQTKMTLITFLCQTSLTFLATNFSFSSSFTSANLYF